jgi:adenine-specific DNA glycosylase
MPTFAAKLIRWQKLHGRSNLPWQNTRDPYAIWVSEIMLQQTQVTTVVPIICGFCNAFLILKALPQVLPMKCWHFGVAWVTTRVVEVCIRRHA